MNTKALAATLLLVVSAVGPAAAAATDVTQDGEAYTGSHIAFETNANAVADYSVNGNTVVDSVAVQSQSNAESSGGIGANVDLKSVTSFSAAGLSVASSSSTQATVQSESGATIEAHDNDRGIMVVTASDSSQYVSANLTSTAEAEQASEKRVVVQKEGGSTGTFIVVGDGDVTVNEQGNVSAQLQEDAKLVYRQYEGERSESEQKQERLIASGTATAEVYYQQAQSSSSGSDGDDSSSDSGSSERAADVVQYSEGTTVEVTGKSANRVNMTVERSQSEGKVVIVSVSEAAMENAENAEVFVDGEAAAKASSYSEVQSAANGGDTSKYMLQSSSSAQASTDVVVGINHFSERQMSVQSGDGSGSTSDSDSSGGSDSGSSPTEGSGPGFGALAAIAAIGAALFTRAKL